MELKIAFFIIVISVSNVFATPTYSQVAKVSLNMKNRSLEQVMDEIEGQSEFYFIFNQKQIDVNRIVNIQEENMLITDILPELFKGTNVNYAILDRKILLTTDPLDNNAISIALKAEQQQNKITGTVTDKNGPIPGANVVVTGTTMGAITDFEGKYSIEVPQGSKSLTFSFIGMESQEINIGTLTQINVTMTELAIGLEEVVVVGYGTQKKINLTGAVDVITNKELSNRQASTVSQMLQGLAPGLNLSIAGQGGFQPGATMSMTIRGNGSLNGGAAYVLIDGFQGDLNNLNPEDIETVTILKDAAASAIYGAKAAYGVILVTTKRGKTKKMSMTYTGGVSVNTPAPLPKMLDSYTYSRVMNEAGDNRGGHRVSDLTIDRVIAYQNKDWEYLRQSMPDWPEGATIFGATPVGNVWDNAAQNYANTDWWDVYYGHSVNQKHDLSLQGGTDKASYYFSTGYLGQDGVLNYGIDNFQRINLMGKVDIAIADWWDFSWETRLSKKHREKFNGDATSPNAGDYSYQFREMGRAYPLTPIYDGWGNYLSESHIPSIEAGTDKTDDIDYWNTFKMEMRPVKGWKINADFAYNYYSSVLSDWRQTDYMHNVDNSLAPNENSVPNSFERFLNANKYWTTNIYSSYNLDIKNIHNFYILGGMQFEYGDNTQLDGYKTNVIVDDVPSLQTAIGNPVLTESISHRAIEGYFSRFSYNYKEKYLLETNVRYDGSYVFRESNRWGFFPSFSLGWNVNKEPFWNNIEKYINTLKFKVSWGQLGNQEVSPYSDIELVPLQTNQLNWIFNYGEPRPVGYTSPPSIVNKNLTWETVTTKNIGTNMSFLNNKLTADLDLFERLTSDMVGPSVVKPGVLGASVPRDNNSSLRTRGWELALNWKQDLKSGLSYFINLNLSNYKSIVTKYFNPTGTLTTWYEGSEVGEIWGYTVYDLFRTQEDLDNYLAHEDLSQIAQNWRTGDVKYEDTNNDGKVSNGKNTINDHGDLSIIGNTEPHYQYGITTGMNFKGFDFSMLWSGIAKRDMYFASGSSLFWGFMGSPWEVTLQPRNLDYFRDQPGTKYSGLYEGDANINTGAYWPRPYLNNTDDRKNKNYPNTRYLQDGSYLRLQNIQVGYSLPQSIVSKLNLQKLRVSFSGENLITFTKLPDGLDPVAPVGYPIGSSYGTAGTGRLTYGADRIYSLELTITF